MTCLIAVERDNRIYYGGDRCETRGYAKHTLAHSKWIAHRNWRIGIIGSCKLGSLLLVDDSWRDILGPASEETAAQVYQFSRAVQSIVTGDHGWEGEKNERHPAAYNSSLIICGPVGVFTIDSNMAVAEHEHGQVVALGAGSDFAVGAWDVCQRFAKKTSVEDQFKICLETAAKFAPSVGGPFDVGSIQLRTEARSTLWEK